MENVWRIVLVALVLAVTGPLWGQTDSGAISLRADEQQVVGDIWRGLGSVHIAYQDITISCDEMEYNRVTEDLVARGHVVLDQGPSRFTAEELHFNVRTKTGLLLDGTGFIPPMYSFSGREIEKLNDTTYRIEGATFTTCKTPDPSPPWSFAIRRATLEVEKYGYFHGAALRVQNAPVFYLPYVVWPIKRERAPGLLMPGFGYSQRRGVFFGLPLYVPIGRSYDTTFTFDYYSKGYYGLDNEWRWAPKADAGGIIDLLSIWDVANQRWQWQVKGKHTDADFHGFQLVAQLEDLSDVDFFQEFDRTFDANTRRDVYSYVYLTRTFGPAALNLRADSRTTYLSSLDVNLAQMPEVELRVRSNPIGHTNLYWDMVSSVNYFDVDRGGDLATRYGRADIFPTLSYTLPSPLWLSVTPRVGGRYTYYTAQYSEDRTHFVDEPIEREYVAGGVDIVGPSVTRIFASPVKAYSRLKHLIEPRIEYRYLDGTEDTSRIPIFDEVDSTPLNNRARLVLANRLLAKSAEGIGARELASLELYQEYSFSEPLNRAGSETSQWGPLSALLRVSPNQGASIDARASFDSLSARLISSSLAGTLQRPIGSLGLTWYQNFNPRTGERISSQVRTMLSFRRQGFPLKASAQLAYDIETSKFQQQQLQVYWEGSCWSVSAEYRDLRLGLYPTRDYRIVISLKGVGNLPEISGSLNMAQ